MIPFLAARIGNCKIRCASRESQSVLSLGKPVSNRRALHKASFTRTTCRLRRWALSSILATDSSVDFTPEVRENLLWRVCVFGLGACQPTRTPRKAPTRCFFRGPKPSELIRLEKSPRPSYNLTRSTIYNSLMLSFPWHSVKLAEASERVGSSGTPRKRGSAVLAVGLWACWPVGHWRLCQRSCWPLWQEFSPNLLTALFKPVEKKRLFETSRTYGLIEKWRPPAATSRNGHS